VVNARRAGRHRSEFAVAKNLSHYVRARFIDVDSWCRTKTGHDKEKSPLLFAKHKKIRLPDETSSKQERPVIHPPRGGGGAKTVNRHQAFTRGVD